MILKSITYSQFVGEPREWGIGQLLLGHVNLLVGENASGKTHTLNVIRSLAKLLSAPTKLTYSSGHYDLIFEGSGVTTNYILNYDKTAVSKEVLKVGDRELLNRGEGGVGRIFAKEMDRDMDFQSPVDELAAVSRRDSIQHPFFQPLYDWASSLHHYSFGTDMGKTHLAVFLKKNKDEDESAFDSKDPHNIVATYKKGFESVGEPFKQAILEDMAVVGYALEDIGVGAPVSVTLKQTFPGPLVGIFVKEKSLGAVTDQIDMSQGMWRALCVVIQINYAEMTGKPSCVLVDDIGEGLDFRRSCALIDLLMHKARRSAIQLVMATNDRFVMNQVPLEAWSILVRHGGKAKVYNYQNSRERFEEFKLTGLNNFDFFATDFVQGGDAGDA